MAKRVGKETLILENKPSIIGSASIAGGKEGEGPLGEYFDKTEKDLYFGEDSWEKAESTMQKKTATLALKKANLNPSQVQYVFAGDLLNQCISSIFGLQEFNIPFLCQYGACSTMAQTLAMASLFIEGGFAQNALAVTSSHFCSAEKQYRYPLEYGGQRAPTAQWTVTGCGSLVLSGHQRGVPYVNAVTVGKIVDLDVKDINNMGAAMAPAAAQTLKSFFSDTKTLPGDYDFIATGDLGLVGSRSLAELLNKEDLVLKNYNDCGVMIFDHTKQDTHSGGSGCGCSASVLCGYIIKKLLSAEFKNILFVATGALMSPTSSFQGRSIPSIAHLVNIQID